MRKCKVTVLNKSHILYAQAQPNTYGTRYNLYVFSGEHYTKVGWCFKYELEWI